MNKCVVCGKGSGKGKTCGSTCRSKLSRSVASSVAKPSVAEGVATVAKPMNFGQSDCECMHCQTNRVNGNRHIINHGVRKSVNDLEYDELNRVPLPGDIDYEPLTSEHCGAAKASCSEVQAIWDRRNAQGQPAMYGEPASLRKDCHD